MYVLLVSNDTVPISTWLGGGTRASTELYHLVYVVFIIYLLGRIAVLRT